MKKKTIIGLVISVLVIILCCILAFFLTRKTNKLSLKNAEKVEIRDRFNDFGLDVLYPKAKGYISKSNDNHTSEYPTLSIKNEQQDLFMSFNFKLISENSYNLVKKDEKDNHLDFSEVNYSNFEGFVSKTPSIGEQVLFLKLGKKANQFLVVRIGLSHLKKSSSNSVPDFTKEKDIEQILNSLTYKNTLPDKYNIVGEISKKHDTVLKPFTFENENYTMTYINEYSGLGAGLHKKDLQSKSPVISFKVSYIDNTEKYKTFEDLLKYRKEMLKQDYKPLKNSDIKSAELQEKNTLDLYEVNKKGIFQKGDCYYSYTYTVFKGHDKKIGDMLKQKVIENIEPFKAK